jgi:hypothetical protein
MKKLLIVVLFFLAVTAYAQCTPPFITSPPTATATVGQTFQYTVTTNVKADITFANVPSWLSVWNKRLVGTPKEAGTYEVIISATNKCGSSVINLVITVE